ncbi:hypothetical protein MLD38_016085 [Melastoma candidum]|uniref:Uncharacterized protein n=1 Tax=Melastoma candidum TaxID=119954 RepID=A0ACB9RHJ9_9MYRT|nr:hypothetical protein MLD38_016085 [Melastoma candidum]
MLFLESPSLGSSIPMGDSTSFRVQCLLLISGYEISRAGSECAPDNQPQLYIMSWNNHFFILRVEKDAYHVIDALGERLFKGCNQAYILKFDDSAVISRVQDATQPPDDKATVEAKSPQPEQDGTKDESSADTRVLVPYPYVTDEDSQNDEEEEEKVVIRGKDSRKSTSRTSWQPFLLSYC